MPQVWQTLKKWAPSQEKFDINKVGKNKIFYSGLYNFHVEKQFHLIGAIASGFIELYHAAWCLYWIHSSQREGVATTHHFVLVLNFNES